MAPVAARSNAPPFLDRLRSSWSSAVDSVKSVIDDIWSSISSALKNLRTWLSDAIKPSQDEYDGTDRVISSATVNTLSPSTAIPALQPTTYPTGRDEEHVATQTVKPAFSAIVISTKDGSRTFSTLAPDFESVLIDKLYSSSDGGPTPAAAMTGEAIAATTAEPPAGSHWMLILRVLLGAGMLVCAGFFWYYENFRFIEASLILLCALLLISPSFVDDDSASFLAKWSTLVVFVSTLLVLGMVHCLSSCCFKHAPFAVGFHLIVIDIVMLCWRSIAFLGWFSLLIGFIGFGIIVAMVCFICECFSESDPFAVGWPSDSYRYQTSNQNFHYHERYATVATRPRTPPSPRPVAVAIPLHDDQETDVERGPMPGRYEIEEGSTGHTYAEIFGPYIDGSLTNVTIEEPWLHERYHFYQLRDCLSAFVEQATNLRSVRVVTRPATGENEAEQVKQRIRQERDLAGIKEWLESEGVDFCWEYAEFHDRWIRLDNGWDATIGRGLSFYHRASGVRDRDFVRRKCRQTTATFIPA
ncbi:MIT domain-containing protein 1-like isoform X1 [Aphelenchoides avenae]|nr:MIT domain-containing protein 1-like isoform X1 [Aphelenchus avenae]